MLILQDRLTWMCDSGIKARGFFPRHFLLQHVTACVSIYTLTAIAVDRYLAICHPLKFRIRASRTIFTMVAIWVWSFVLILPQVGTVVYMYHGNKSL